MDRNINLSEEQLNRLEKGALLSSQKGIKESLVLMDELAFIINTGNNTVVTAMQKGNEGENIYTNIDGAVLV
jgi:flagellar operon protein